MKLKSFGGKSFLPESFVSAVTLDLRSKLKAEHRAERDKSAKSKTSSSKAIRRHSLLLAFFISDGNLLQQHKESMEESSQRIILNQSKKEIQNVLNVLDLKLIRNQIVSVFTYILFLSKNNK